MTPPDGMHASGPVGQGALDRPDLQDGMPGHGRKAGAARAALLDTGPGGSAMVIR